MRISREDSVALIIDIQDRLFPHISDHDALEKNTGILIEGLKILKVPMLLTQQYTKGLGETIPSLSERLENIKPIEKISFSCCEEGKVMTELSRMNKKFIILAGIEAHVCVLQTFLDLIDNGFTPVVVEDCISSRKGNDKKIALDRMKREGAVITTYESILLELCRVAGTDEFKSISKLIK